VKWKEEKKRLLCERNKAKIRSINFALVGSEKFEAKRTEKKSFLRERAKRMRNGSRFASFRFEAKHFFGETGAPYSHLLSNSIFGFFQIFTKPNLKRQSDDVFSSRFYDQKTPPGLRLHNLKRRDVETYYY
jgi:hypothetical protein